MNSNKQIKWGAILSYLSIFLNIAAGLLYTPWMVKQIRNSDYGLYTLANSLITLFVVDFGLSAATSRFISKYRAEGNEEKINNFLGAVYKLYLLIDLVIFTIFTVVYFFLDSIYVNLTPLELERLKVVYIISASYSVFHFPFTTFNGILNAHEKFAYIKITDVLHKLLTIASIVICLLFGLGLYALVIVNAISGMMTVLVKYIIIKRTTGVKASFRSSEKSIYKDIFGFSIWMAVATIAQRLIFNITPTILGIVASTAAIAVFGIINTIEGYSYTFTNAINGMFMPKISKIYANDDADGKIMRLMLSVGKFQYALNGLIVAGFAVVGKSFINLWMGTDYSEAYLGILLVIIPGLFYNSLQIANTSMMVKNKVKIQAYVTLITGVTNVILSFWFAAIFGVVGACLSIFVAYMVRAILTNILAHRVLKINMFYFARKCYIRMSLPIFLTLGAGVGIDFLLNKETWLFLAIKVLLITLVYLVAVFIVGLDRNERKSVMRIIRR